MNAEVRCGSCHAVVAAADVDAERELASCGQCGRLTDLRRAAADPATAAGTPGEPRTRRPLQLPVGMSMTTAANVIIRRRWLRGKHWLMLAVLATAGAYVAYMWATAGASVWLVIGTLFVVSWNFALAGMFLNSTVVTADAAGVKVVNGPLPSLLARSVTLQKQDIDQLYAGKHGSQFAVMARLNSGETLRLVAPLITADQALFIEQQVERMLGLVDMPVTDELDGAAFNLAGRRPAGAGSGAVLVVLIPVFLGAMLTLFMVIASTEVSGRLQAKAALGAWAFAPDDCTSGQRESFDGVVLTAKRDSRMIRVVRDPVRGPLVVVASPGLPNRVLAQDSCSLFQVNVNRTSTSINEIWVVDGNLALECGELAGSVVFEGCH